MCIRIPNEDIRAGGIGGHYNARPIVVASLPKQTTNYYHLICKTPEELAEWLGDTDACPPGECTHTYDSVDCPECWLEWLNS